jgi:NADP-dependent 3-hydroxy acid dehydrogenase YdfG
MPVKPGVAVVTGASAGVGRAVSEELGRRGWKVGLIARGETGLKAAAAELEHGLPVVADVSDHDALERAAGAVEEELGPIDLWVNNAMTTVFAPIWDVEPDELKRATEVTYLGQAYGTMVALRRMRPRDSGVICNVGSALAFRAIPLQSAYCGAKFATRGFTEAVRAELMHDGSKVRITEVHLPAVNTPQFEWCLNRLPKVPQPVPPVYSPDLIARKILDSCETPRRHKVVGGFNRFLVAANKLAPGVIDHYVARNAVESQQTERDAPADARFDLWEPVDDGEDRGARGAYGDKEGGVLGSGWIYTTPKLAFDVGAAAAARVVDVVSSKVRG